MVSCVRGRDCSLGGEADAKHVYFHADAISMEIHVIVTFSDTQTDRQTDRHTDTQTYMYVH